MILSKHKQHRNSKYLDWLRSRPCVVSGQKAECAHHIRLGTNGATSLKPSDYFCIPLLHEFHTTGSMALHIVGEETFLAHFKLDAQALFIKYLKEYLIEKHEIYYMLEGRTREETIADLIGLIENKLPKMSKVSKKAKPKTKAKADESSPKPPSITESEYYQKAKELKKQRDKELRKQLKQNSPKTPARSLKGQEHYEKAKEKRRQMEKDLRKKLKERQKQHQLALKEKISRS